MNRFFLFVFLAAPLLAASPGAILAREPAGDPSLDRKVRAFLDAHSGAWRDRNVPAADGMLLHDIIVRNGYRRALENFRKAGLSEYVDYIKSRKDFETTFDDRGAGVSISRRKR